MTQTYIFSAAAFIAGFVIAWIVRTIAMAKLQKSLKSTQGYLESALLKKETLQKENVHVHQLKQAAEMECEKKLEQANKLNKILDEDILLLQKSNEETEALLRQGQPALHALKLQLLDAHNTIARYKAQQQVGKKV
ncbi:hypothetical protein QWZ08_12175 [Ferruginibacter paludis]|uniref:hypothetical protein n=1 Tax=Ferruginibacter paludis TaxID=1310417 RepID=UPI0025B5668E|nr:hypothetical protein [Ferruginibacter paludis]MDN3656391.1 hypothetical protein [Ferruginibacter paludis]